jgi:LDH2 family malate/lactate/ureidoglycolate dehydrogenase
LAKVKVNLAELNEKAKLMLTREGVPEEDAEVVIKSIQEAEVCGVESHGYTRLSSYVQRINKGLMNTNPNIKIEKCADSLLKVDADKALGQVVTSTVLDRCIEEAKAHGCCMAIINNSNHFGTCGYYGRIAARQGMIAIIASNGAPCMPPFGGMENMLSTSPLSVSFPAGKYDNFTIDMAMSCVARGKIRVYDKMNKEIPLGWATDSEGNDTTDPKKALEGSLLPIGGHKGYGLAMVVDMLCGVLSGGKISSEIETMFKATIPSDLGHFIAIIDPSKLINMDFFITRVENWFDEIKASPKRAGFAEILIPGELENRKATIIPEEIEIIDKTLETIG